MANNHAGAHGTSHGQSDEHHMVPFADYIKVFSVLIVLTAVTVYAASFDFGTWNTIIAFAIATVKATLVLGIFMHLKYDAKIYRWIMGAAVFFLIVLFAVCQIDEITRIIRHAII